MFYAPVQDMQRPTHPRLHVRNIRDAHTVFEAVRQGILRPVERRLHLIERSMFIRSGAIFVWEESEDGSGLKRWTDGRVWGQSRKREPYRFYDEKLPSEEGKGPSEQPRFTVNIRFVDGIARSRATSPTLSHYGRSAQHPTGLVKQAYSAWVPGQGSTKSRKWHLTAYFTYADLPRIPTIDQDAALRNVMVPAGMYKSAKARSRNSDAGTSHHPSPAIAIPQSLSPPPRAGSSLGHHTRAGEGSWTLPPLHMAVAPTQHDTHTSRKAHDARSAEDQRMIQMLNSRPIL